MNPEIGIERPLPHSKEAEQFVLGSILVSNPKARAVFDSLAVADFFIPQNQRIFAALKKLSEAGKPTDCLSAPSMSSRERSSSNRPAESVTWASSVTTCPTRATSSIPLESSEPARYGAP